MKILSKVTALAASSALVLSLAACGGTAGTTTAPDTTGSAEGTASYTVGICQQMTHEPGRRHPGLYGRPQ